VRYWNTRARSNSQRFYLWVWLLGCFPVGALLYAFQEPEGRWQRGWEPGCLPPNQRPETAREREARECDAEMARIDRERAAVEAELEALGRASKRHDQALDYMFVKTGLGREL
jgi:hypothetical protein